MKLLEPGKIGTLKLANRIVMASMGTRLAGVWGEVNEATTEWYARRARGGTGLITVEATHVAAALFPGERSRPDADERTTTVSARVCSLWRRRFTKLAPKSASNCP